MQTIRIHSSIASAAAIVGIGERVVSAKWKQTANQTSKERAVILPMEVLLAPEVPEAFRPLVESCLLASAEQTLKDFVNLNENNYEMLPSLFGRGQLTENFLTKSEAWLSREDLEKAFTMSATWKRISGNPNFATNKTFQNIAGQYRDAILKLSAKTAYLAPELRENILAKLSEDDLSTEMGAFILRRFDQMGKKDSAETISFDAL